LERRLNSHVIFKFENQIHLYESIRTLTTFNQKVLKLKTQFSQIKMAYPSLKHVSLHDSKLHMMPHTLFPTQVGHNKMDVTGNFATANTYYFLII